MTDEYMPKRHELISDYYSLPKKFGSVACARLTKIAHHATYLADTLPTIPAGDLHAIAGSATIETLLNRPHSEDEVDQSIDEIDTAIGHLQLAANSELARLEHGLRHPNSQEDWLRAQVTASFGNLYKDIICGEVSSQTITELSDQLRYYENYAIIVKDMDHGHNTSGLISELVAYQTILAQHNTPTDPVAIPASVRADSGDSLRADTHDIVVCTPSPDDIPMFEGFEVKSSGSRADNMRRRLGNAARYRCGIIYVNQQSHTIRTLDPMRRAAA